MLVGNIVQEKITHTKRKNKTGKDIFSTQSANNSDKKEINIDKVNITSSLWMLQSIENIDNYEVDIKMMHKTGDMLLKELNNIRMSLICGDLNADNIRNLSKALKDSKIELKYPELQEVLNDIRLRAAVELAKLRQWSGASCDEEEDEGEAL